MKLNKKAVFRGAVGYKEQFAKSSCCISISVGQATQEGEKLGAAIKLVNRSFASCDIMVGDSLQRFSLKLDSELGVDDLHEEANVKGERWIADNQKYFELFTIPYRIIRWDHWLNHSDYPQKRQLVDNLFARDAEYRQAYYTTTEIFWERYIKRVGVNGAYEMLQPLSLEYLKEECAVFLLWADAGYEFEIYSTKHNPAVKLNFCNFMLQMGKMVPIIAHVGGCNT